MLAALVKGFATDSVISDKILGFKKIFRFEFYQDLQGFTMHLLVHFKIFIVVIRLGNSPYSPSASLYTVVAGMLVVDMFDGIDRNYLLKSY